MSFTQFTNLDFNTLWEQIKSYLRSNSNFTDFDFEGSNFSVLIDTLAYNTYINAFNANLATNEVFLDSAVIRENVVSLARNIGYVPRSKTCAQAEISFQVQIKDDNHEISQITLNPGLVCIGAANDTSYRFSIIRPVTERVYTNSSGNRVADFNITIHQGTYVRNQYVADTKSSVKYILDNSNIDTSTIIINVSDTSSTLGSEYSRVDNLFNVFEVTPRNKTLKGTRN